MHSNFQGRKRVKSVSFRGSSNDSNFYENKPRNDNNSYDGRPRSAYREQYNYEGSNRYGQDDIESRVIKLLPDANMTISVANDLKSNKSRPRGSRGILKSQSFRDDTILYNRSNEFYSRSPEYNNRSSDCDDYNASGRRGFETHSFQSGRSRGRARGFHNRLSYPSKFQENDHEFDKDFSQPNNFYRGRGKTERSRRARGSRGQGRGKFNRTSEEYADGPTSGDGDKECEKDSIENNSEHVSEETNIEGTVNPESAKTNDVNDVEASSEIAESNTNPDESVIAKSCETATKPEENQEKHETEEIEQKTEEKPEEKTEVTEQP